MLAQALVALFNAAFCTGYVLLLIYVGPYLALIQFFGWHDYLHDLHMWVINKAIEYERSEK